jgi:hypothetical protein
MARKSNQMGNPALLALAASRAGGSGGPPAYVPDQDDHKLVRGLVIGGVSIVGAGALFLLGRSLMRNAAFKSSINRTDDAESAENFAQRLINAFSNDSPFGWGTDEELVRNTIREVPHKKFWDDVKAAYKRLTKGRNLMTDLDSELSRTEKREIDLILSSLPANASEARNPLQVTPQRLDAWAERIRQAALYETSWVWPYGTDEEAIYAVLEELPLAQTACQLEFTYRRKFGKGLLQEITDEMEGEELDKVFRIIMQKPDAKGKTLNQLFASCQ